MEHTVTAAATRRRGPSSGQWVLIVVTAIALGVTVWMGLRVGSQAFGQLSSTAYPTPLSRTMTMSAGRWTVYERTGSQTGGAGINFTENGPVQLDPSDVTVTASDGTQLEMSIDDRNETITRGGAVYTGAVAFQVPARDTYKVTIGGNGDAVIITRSLFDGLGGAIVVMVLAGLAFITALAALGISAIVRHRRNRPQPPMGGWPGPYPGGDYNPVPYGTAPYGTAPYGTPPYGTAPYGPGGGAPYGTPPPPPAYRPPTSPGS